MNRRSIKGLLLIALALALGASAVAVAVANPSGRTYVTGDCLGAAFKPRSVVLTCGDAGLSAIEVQWKQWGSARAHGAGLGEEKICTPNCAEGGVAKGKIRLLLFQPRLCPQDGKRHFTKVRYSWPNGAPGEGPKQGTIPLPCSIVSN